MSFKLVAAFQYPYYHTMKYALKKILVDTLTLTLIHTAAIFLLYKVRMGNLNVGQSCCVPGCQSCKH